MEVPSEDRMESICDNTTLNITEDDVEKIVLALNDSSMLHFV
jgi:hypothetical protein